MPTAALKILPFTRNPPVARIRRIRNTLQVNPASPHKKTPSGKKQHRPADEPIRGDIGRALGVLPAFVEKKTARWVLGSEVLLKRAMQAGRLTIVRQGGRGRSTLIDYESLLRLVEFIREGGQLPLLPSEKKPRNH